MGLLSIGDLRASKSVEDARIEFDLMVSKYLVEFEQKHRIDLVGGENGKYARQIDLLIGDIRSTLLILELNVVCDKIIAKNLQPEEAMSELLTSKGLVE